MEPAITTLRKINQIQKHCKKILSIFYFISSHTGGECIAHPYIGTCRGQKNTLDPLELELQAKHEPPNMDAGHQTPEHQIPVKV